MQIGAHDATTSDIATRSQTIPAQSDAASIILDFDCQFAEDDGTNQKEDF